MKRHDSLVSLSQNHHHALILAQVLKKHVKDYKNMPKTVEEKVGYAKDFYKDELQPHFEMEEEILFPAAEGKDPAMDELIRELLVDHRKLEVLVHELDVNNNGLEEKLDKIGHLLDQHVRKEERVLFERIQEVMTEEELADVNLKIKASIESRRVPD